MGKALRVGDKAPDFAANSASGDPVSLADFAGRYLVLYFYPKAFTPGCTRETICFRDNHAEVVDYNADIVGVSTDAAETQQRFAAEIGVPFPLLPDQDKAICAAYGVTRAFLPITKRITYVIDPDGRIAARFEHELAVGKHLDDVLGYLRSVVPKDCAKPATDRTRDDESSLA